MSLSLTARAEDWGQKILRIILLFVSVPLLTTESYCSLHGLPASLYNTVYSLRKNVNSLTLIPNLLCQFL